MKNISTQKGELLKGGKQVFRTEELENFDKKEFADVLNDLDKISCKPSKRTLDNVLNYARNN